MKKVLFLLLVAVSLMMMACAQPVQEQTVQVPEPMKKEVPEPVVEEVVEEAVPIEEPVEEPKAESAPKKQPTKVSSANVIINEEEFSALSDSINDVSNTLEVLDHESSVEIEGLG